MVQKVYRPQTKFGVKEYFHKRLSFCPREVWGGGRVCIQGDLHPGGILHPGGSASRRSAYRGNLHRGGVCADTPCIQWDTMGYSQQVGGTHPPEMHSCLRKCSLLFVQCHGKFSCSPVANNGKAHSKILFLKTYG